jgi:hypothetical protein
MATDNLIVEFQSLRAFGEVPEARWGHGCAFLEESNSVFLTGGQNKEFGHLASTHVFNLGMQRTF